MIPKNHRTAFIAGNTAFLAGLPHLQVNLHRIRNVKLFMREGEVNSDPIKPVRGISNIRQFSASVDMIQFFAARMTSPRTIQLSLCLSSTELREYTSLVSFLLRNNTAAMRGSLGGVITTENMTIFLRIDGSKLLATVDYPVNT